MAGQGRGKVKLSDGTYSTFEETTEIKEKAKQLFVEDDWSVRRISMFLGPSEQSVHKWKRADRWERLKKKGVLTKERELLKRLTKEAKSIDHIDEAFIVQGLLDIATSGDSETNRLNAWKALGDWRSMFKQEDGNKDVQDKIEFSTVRHPKKDETLVLETVTPAQMKERAKHGVVPEESGGKA